MTATVTNTGSRAGADVAQLYVTDPAASGQPPRQLEGFPRVNLAAGASQHGHRSRSPSGTCSTGTRAAMPGPPPPAATAISVGDSDAHLPLTGTLAVASAQLGQPVTITSPGPQEGMAGTAVSVPVPPATPPAGRR